MDAGLKKENLYEQRSKTAEIVFAIRNAGGLYFWWNQAAIYWGGSAFLILSGLAVTRYKPRPKDEGGKGGPGQPAIRSVSQNSH
jgi:hypothetical protein